MHSSNGSNAPECRLPACSRTIVGWSGAEVSAFASASGRILPSLVGVDELGRGQAGEPQGEVRRRVPLPSREHPDRRRPGQPACQVPAPGPQRRVARGDEPGEVRHRRPGGESDAAAGGQPQQLEEPRRRDLLDRDRGRGDLAQHGVLVPGADQPVRSECGRLGPTDHEPEEAPGRHPRQPRFARGRQQVDHVLGRAGTFRELAAERVRDGVGVGLRAHRPVGEAGQPAARVGMGALEGEIRGRVHGRCAHGPSLCRRPSQHHPRTVAV